MVKKEIKYVTKTLTLEHHGLKSVVQNLRIAEVRVGTNEYDTVFDPNSDSADRYCAALRALEEQYKRSTGFLVAEAMRALNATDSPMAELLGIATCEISEAKKNKVSFTEAEKNFLRFIIACSDAFRTAFPEMAEKIRRISSGERAR